MSTEKRVHLVLSGGGIKCIAYAGALAALTRNGYSVESVASVSAGTFIGAWFCAGVKPEEIEATVIETDLRAIVGGRPVPQRLHHLLAMVLFGRWRSWPFALYDPAHLVDYFHRLVPRELTLGELTIPFATAGIDLINDRILVYSNESHPKMLAADAVRIAMALPLLFPPHRTAKRIVVDAALATNTPVWLAMGREDSLPIVVLRPSQPRSLETPRTLAAYVTRMMQSGVHSRDYYILSQLPRVREVEIRTDDLSYDRFDLSRKEREALVLLGEDAMEDALGHLDELVPAAPLPTDPTPQQERQEEKAEERGEETMRAFVGNLSTQARNSVFISYSRRDAQWLERLQEHLRPYTRNRSMSVWADTEIRPGARWREEIQRALRSAKVAVLLVTPSFLASDFIADEELTHFLDAQQHEGLVIIWVAVSASAYETTFLSDIEAANDDLRMTLDLMSEGEQNRELVRICKQIALALR